MRVVFMGTPDIAATCLKKILADGFDVVGVYTQPDRPKGRGMKLTASPVKETALAAGIPVFQPESFREEEDVETLRRIKLLRQLRLRVEEIRRIQRGERALADAAAEQGERLREEESGLALAGELCRELRAAGRPWSGSRTRTTSIPSGTPAPCAAWAMRRPALWRLGWACWSPFLRR